DQGRTILRAFAETNRRHLRERTNRLRFTATNTLDAGHERRRDGAKSGRENAELAAGGANVGRCHEIILLSILIIVPRFGAPRLRSESPSSGCYGRVPVFLGRRSQKLF